MFRAPIAPSSAAHKNLVAASGTDHVMWGASYLKRDHVVTFEVAPSQPAHRTVTYTEYYIRCCVKTI